MSLVLLSLVVDALRCAPRQSWLWGKMSPVTASVNFLVAVPVAVAVVLPVVGTFVLSAIVVVTRFEVGAVVRAMQLLLTAMHTPIKKTFNNLRKLNSNLLPCVKQTTTVGQA